MLVAFLELSRRLVESFPWLRLWCCHPIVHIRRAVHSVKACGQLIEHDVQNLIAHHGNGSTQFACVDVLAAELDAIPGMSPRDGRRIMGEAMTMTRTVVDRLVLAGSAPSDVIRSGRDEFIDVLLCGVQEHFAHSLCIRAIRAQTLCRVRDDLTFKRSDIRRAARSYRQAILKGTPVGVCNLKPVLVSLLQGCFPEWSADVVERMSEMAIHRARERLDQLDRSTRDDEHISHVALKSIIDTVLTEVEHKLMPLRWRVSA